MGVVKKINIKKVVQFLSLMSFMSSLVGCATPTATLSPDISAGKYNRVFFFLPEEDPRNIFPKVVSRLENLGFDVRIVKENETIEGSQGTGFIVNHQGHILTCSHIFDKERIASVWIKGTRYEASIIRKDEKNDLALLKLDDNSGDSFQPLRISQSPDYKMGQEIYTIGFPLSDILGNSARLNKGLISSTVGLKDNPDHLQVSAEIQPGNSGGPLLNKNGTVIGIMQSTLSPISVLARTGGNLPQNVNFAAKTNIINDFINTSIKNISLPQDETEEIGFDQVSNSVVQIRAGKITDEYLRQSKMVCIVQYISFWDLWFRFKIFQVEFYDFDTGDLILKAGQYGDNMLSNETKVIDQTFEQIKEKFFPNS